MWASADPSLCACATYKEVWLVYGNIGTLYYPIMAVEITKNQNDDFFVTLSHPLALWSQGGVYFYPVYGSEVKLIPMVL